MSGALYVDRFLHTAMFYPGNYGFIPQTLSTDGDPMDVCVLTEKVVRLEGNADDAHADGLKKAFKRDYERPMQFIIAREIYKHLERITDAFEDVANEIDGIVIDHT